MTRRFASSQCQQAWSRSVVRVHQEDCCQALGIPPHRKYEVDGGPSLIDIARLLQQIQPGGHDVYELLRVAAFNWLVLGTDAHGKNTSLLLSGRQMRLAPMYDVASMAPYGEHPKKLRLAQKIGNEYRPTNITGDHWSRVAVATGIDAEKLLGDIEKMAQTLPVMMHLALSGTLDEGLSNESRAAGESLVEAIAKWTMTCLTRL